MDFYKSGTNIHALNAYRLGGWNCRDREGGVKQICYQMKGKSNLVY